MNSRAISRKRARPASLDLLLATPCVCIVFGAHTLAKACGRRTRVMMSVWLRVSGSLFAGSTAPSERTFWRPPHRTHTYREAIIYGVVFYVHIACVLRARARFRLLIYLCERGGDKTQAGRLSHTHTNIRRARMDLKRRSLGLCLELDALAH